VREKLRTATAAAEQHPDRYSRNIVALSAVTPPDLTPEQITPQLGAVWIHERYVQRFLADILDDPSVVVARAGSTWTVEGNKTSALATSQWAPKPARPPPSPKPRWNSARSSCATP
jgi:N12 class adenine-specific DNA methylase